MTRYLGQFEATDPGGTRYVLHAWRDDAGGLRLETADGQAVTRVRTGQYQLVRHNLLVDITAEDPAAP